MGELRKLWCELSDYEREQYEHKAGKHGLALANLEHRISELKDQAKTEKDAIAALAKAVRDGREERMVECDEVKVPELCETRIIRQDTGAIVEQVAWTAEERQAELFDEPKNAKKKRSRPLADGPAPETPEAGGPKTTA